MSINTTSDAAPSQPNTTSNPAYTGPERRTGAPDRRLNQDEDRRNPDRASEDDNPRRAVELTGRRTGD